MSHPRVPVVAVALLALSAPLALAAPLPPAPSVILALPGAWLTNYATPASVVAPGGTLTFHNFDIMRHNVVAFGAYGSDDQPWCIDYVPGECPLFWSPWTDGLGASSEVLGLELLVPGQVYSYYCAPHPSMEGTLVALPGAAP